MTDEQGEQAKSKVMERLYAVKWDGDWDEVFGKTMSRRLLMREYLRRSALWAQTYSAESVWPFYDITEFMDPEFKLSPGIAQELDTFLRARMSADVKVTCRGAVRLAELRLHNPANRSGKLPDLYEPLIRLYERGGEFMTDNAGALDLTGVSFRPGSLQGNASNTPVVALHNTVLDALDVEGRVTFYASDSDRGPVFRRLLPQGGGQRNEVFSGELGWQPTTQLFTLDGDRGYARIDDQEAARLIEVAVLGAPRCAGQE
ncbi:hypothetical protein OHA63_11900 [Streptomyces anulatus]|uniref:hypothetical protein n=1 Tax=Streptomyces anulatus TaxID=1892 RepID=UPI002E3250C8|nr:hypothetical protein [Streptomyces anulatus]